jgi:hypothetical protein
MAHKSDGAGCGRGQRGRNPARSQAHTSDIPATSLSSGNLNDSFSLSAFDPSLGTLTGVTITLNLDAVATPEIFNVTGGAGSETVSTSFATTLTGPDGTLVSATTASGPVTGAANTTALSITPLPSTAVTQTVSASASNLSSYEGTGSLTFDLIAPASPGFTDSGTQLTGPATLAAGGTGSIYGDSTATVSYTFEAALEPSSWALGLIALGGMFVLRRRALRA